MEARRGRDAAGDSMHSTTARPAVSHWPGTPGLRCPMNTHAQDGPHAQSIEEVPLLLELRLAYGRSGAAGSAVFEGHQAESSGRRLESETGIHGEDEFSR